MKHVIGNLAVMVSCAVAVLTGRSGANEFNYGEVLQKSIYFFECQQAGKLPSWNRVEWRGTSCVNDGTDVGHDLTGGWFDAGDHVKFNLPMAFSATMLAWGALAWPEAYAQSAQMEHLRNNLRFVADYLVRCHTADNEFYGQVGNGALDHAFWGPAESVEAHMERPAYKVDALNPGSEVAGEAAAALAAIALVFDKVDASYARKLLMHAEQLYSFAKTYQGTYSKAIPDVQGYYYSFSGYKDELCWAACWLYKATSTPAYLADARSWYAELKTMQQRTEKAWNWTISWDDKGYGCYVLMAQITGEDVYHGDVRRWLDYWTVGVEGNKIHYTPGGLAWLDSWGANRYSANTSFCALVYSDMIDDAGLKTRYRDFAVSQIRYILGDNPRKSSFVVGFGHNPPRQPHHRTCHGVYPGDASDTNDALHCLYGALAGGPGRDDSYEDRRNNYINNEVACDYNAAFTGAVARLFLEFGGEPLKNFPPAEPREPEFFVEAAVNVSGERFTEIRSVIKNRSSWPARSVSNLSFRYYVDLSEVVAGGLSAQDVQVTTNYVQGTGIVVSPMVHDSGDIYYVKVDLTGVTLYPGTQDSYRREIQFRIALPDNAPAALWNPANDWSFQGLRSGYAALDVSLNIPVFEGEVQVFGARHNQAPVAAVRSHVPVSPMGGAAMKLRGRMLEINGIPPGRATVILTSLTGRVARRFDSVALPGRMDCGDLPAGRYVVQVCRDGITVVPGRALSLGVAP